MRLCALLGVAAIAQARQHRKGRQIQMTEIETEQEKEKDKQ